MMIDPDVLESLALDEDREKALAQLIPGSQEYYFYHCLYHQNAGRMDQVDALTEEWIKRHGRTSMVEEIETRSAILSYETQPKVTLDYLERTLKLKFNHQRQAEHQVSRLPTELDVNRINREAFTKEALSRYPKSLAGFQGSALYGLMDTELEPGRLGELLDRIRRPHHPNLANLVHKDLMSQKKPNFGSRKIHSLLLLPQLQILAARDKSLLEQKSFVNTWLNRLKPGVDEDWHSQPHLERAYLERLWSFANTLGPVFNSLKVHVLYHRLAFDMGRGEHDLDRFITYLKLPRKQLYTAAALQHNGRPADMGAAFDTLYDPPNWDEHLVRDYLSHFFVGMADPGVFRDYIRYEYLTDLFARTKILCGAPEPETWYAMLDNPEQMGRLRDRVDIQFAPENKTLFNTADPVSLDVHIKNVPTLVVKVFEINTPNYFLENDAEVDVSIDLDGLVAADETTYTYDDPPQRRVRRTFQFPALQKPGIYVIDFIGNGKSSRALIRKGQLCTTHRLSAAGHVFAIHDETGAPVPEAALWLGGREFTPRTDGGIVIPYTTQPGPKKAMLRHGNFGRVITFEHLEENYTLEADFHVERESLLTNQTAALLIRSSLRLNGTRVPLSLLEDIRLSISAVNSDQMNTAIEIAPFALSDDEETIQSFRVPPRTQTLIFKLKARIAMVSSNQKLDISASESVHINGMDETDRTADVHLSRTTAGYCLYMLGKTGEPRADKPVNLSIRHRDFKQEMLVDLQTDATGCIQLGQLADITSIKLQCNNQVWRNWKLDGDRFINPKLIHALAGSDVLIPRMATQGDGAGHGSGQLLLEKVGNEYLRDLSDHVMVTPDFFKITDLEPGVYEFYCIENNYAAQIRVGHGEVKRWSFGNRRILQLSSPKPLQIGRMEQQADSMTLHVIHANAHTRVHVAVTRFLPDFHLFQALSRMGCAEPAMIPMEQEVSAYCSGRDIGDEHRYILERKYANRYPGNLLDKPGLLLNPWSNRNTDMDTAAGAAAGGYAPTNESKRPSINASPKASCQRSTAKESFTNLDFLAGPARILTNLRPDENGLIHLKNEDLGGPGIITVVALDSHNVVTRQIIPNQIEISNRDLRLIAGLDPKYHFSERNQITPLRAGQKLTTADVGGTRINTYSCLRDVFRLYGALSQNPVLADFKFITNWPNLTHEEKREHYSRYACHELHYFLFRKDPAFFKTVITTFLRCKKDKTFLDHYLLGDDLSNYLAPWAYGRLNVVERILLADRMDGEAEQIARQICDDGDLLPTHPEADARRFQAALNGTALDTQSKDRRKGTLNKSSGLRSKFNGKLKKRNFDISADLQAVQDDEASLGQLEQAELMDDPEDSFKNMDFMEIASDHIPRNRLARFYLPGEKTEEWAENNYYRLTIEQQIADLVPTNPFWCDYAVHKANQPFLSPNFTIATRNLTEMMFALSVLDLPFEAQTPQINRTNHKLELSAKEACIIFHREIQRVEPAADKTSILVAQNYFLKEERYRYEGKERLEQYVTGAFMVHKVYECQVVLTNTGSAGKKLDLLLQIPQGSVPVSGGFETRSEKVSLKPFASKAVTYAFYFPQPGTYSHYSARVTSNGSFLVAAPPSEIQVETHPITWDKTSWPHISQHGKPAEVLKFLECHNLARLDLNKIAWRLHDQSFYHKTLNLLEARHFYHHTSWSYAIKHNDTNRITELLKHADDFINTCGPWFKSPLITIDPVERHNYEHLEYAPLINARILNLGATPKILNEAFENQYRQFLEVTAYRKQPREQDLMAAACYLLVQDRIEDGLAVFARVKPRKNDIQYDYLHAFTLFYSENPMAARALAEPYANYSVDHWRRRFGNILAQLSQLEGGVVSMADDDNREQQNAVMAEASPVIDFEIEAGEVNLTWRNLKRCQINYYLMDVELLFSRQPFVQQDSKRFGVIQPNHSETRDLDDTGHKKLPIPETFRSKNVVVEVVTGASRVARIHYAHNLQVGIMAQYGRLQVTTRTRQPLPKTYVKVYAKMGGSAAFYKDGYTDHRGCFDYASLSTSDLDRAARFAILIMNDTHGSVIREVDPPGR